MKINHVPDELYLGPTYFMDFHSVGVINDFFMLCPRIYAGRQGQHIALTETNDELPAQCMGNYETVHGELDPLQ